MALPALPEGNAYWTDLHAGKVALLVAVGADVEVVMLLTEVEVAFEWVSDVAVGLGKLVCPAVVSKKVCGLSMAVKLLMPWPIGTIFDRMARICGARSPIIERHNVGFMIKTQAKDQSNCLKLFALL